MRKLNLTLLMTICVVGFVLSVVPAQEQGGSDRLARMMRFFPVIAALDADENGVISEDEIQNAVAALKGLDKDGNGKLTQEELRPSILGGGGRRAGGTGGGRGGPGGGRGPDGPSGGFDFVERVMSNDKNDDGKVTKEELPEFMQRMIERADTNEDGAIDKAEAEAMAASFRNRGANRGPGSQGGRPEPSDESDPKKKPESDKPEIKESKE